MPPYTMTINIQLTKFDVGSGMNEGIIRSRHMAGATADRNSATRQL